MVTLCPMAILPGRCVPVIVHVKNEFGKSEAVMIVAIVSVIAYLSFVFGIKQISDLLVPKTLTRGKCGITL